MTVDELAAKLAMIQLRGLGDLRVYMAEAYLQDIVSVELVDHCPPNILAYSVELRPW